MDLGWHAGISAAVDLDNSYESEQVHIHYCASCYIFNDGII